MEDVLDVIDQYRRTYAQLSRAHAVAATRQNRKRLLFGIPAIIASLAVSAAILLTLHLNPDVRTRLAIGGLSMAVTVLCALQTFFRFAEVAAQHAMAARKYEAIHRQLELLHLKYKNEDAEMRADALLELESVNETVTKTADESPSLPNQLVTMTERLTPPSEVVG